MLCAVDYIFNLLSAVNCLQPMNKFVFSFASRATRRLQIKPSGSGDENGVDPTTHAHNRDLMPLNGSVFVLQKRHRSIVRSLLFFVHVAYCFLLLSIVLETS